MKVTPRTRKLNEAVRESIATILIEEVQDPRVDLATVTGASVSSDMRYADIYVTTHGDTERYDALIAGLESAKNRIRASLAQRVSMKFMPALRFHIDTSVDAGQRMAVALREEAERRPITPDPEPETEPAEGEESA
jgi:ribosome-binding factor A